LFVGLYGLYLDLFIGLLGSWNEINPVEDSDIFLSRQPRSEMLFNLSIGLVLGSIVGLISWLSIKPILGSILGLAVGLILGFTVVLLIGLRVDLKTRNRPNQGIWQSAKNIWLIAALSYPAGVILWALPSLATARPVTLEQSLLAGVPCALIIGFASSGIAIVQHVTLRFVLHRQGVMPWNYAQFLNYSAERRLLQRIGGRYRFIHRLLMEHFAAMGDERIWDRVEERGL